MKQPHIPCKDGHYVRSNTEKIIDDFFYENNINHAYEMKIYCKEIKRYISPDWYLPDLCGGVLYEHFGEWSETNYKKILFYRENKIKFIYTNWFGDTSDVIETLKGRLEYLKTKGYDESVNGFYFTSRENYYSKNKNFIGTHSDDNPFDEEVSSNDSLGF